MVHADPLLLADVRARWRIPEQRWPWLPKACVVRILFYADFFNAYDAGSFGGLKEVIATLQADPYYWIVFDVSLASRVNDSTADADKRNQGLHQLNLNDYDELWLFGVGGLPSVLAQEEIDAGVGFMNQGGGVLVTGDHADLGAAIASAIPRVGKLRKWANAPSQFGLDRHSTLREGGSLGYQFVDQSDETPQTLRLRRYLLTSYPFWQQRSMPHPIMCGPEGPIVTFPDHMHEGEVIVPATFPAPEWPSVGGFQPKPEIVAWGTIVQPGLDKTGQEFGVVGAYDGHPAGVGRIGADATWHHWFDINLIGDNGVVGGSTGFNASNADPKVLKQIEAYFLNMAIWLAPPTTQFCMRNVMIWGAIWRDPLFMISPNIPPLILGEQAVDALGKYAPRCTIYRWIWETFPLELVLRVRRLLDDPSPCPPWLEEAVLGAALQPILAEVRRLEGPPVEIDREQIDNLVNGSFARAAEIGLEIAMDALDEARQAGRLLTRRLRAAAKAE